MPLGWRYHLWTSETDCRWLPEEEGLAPVPWLTQRTIDAMPEWNGKADLMRYEILARHGGVCVDADSECLLPLPDAWLEHEGFACFENENACPGWVATGYLGARPGSRLMTDTLARIEREDFIHTWDRKAAWFSVGPGALNRTLKSGSYDLEIHPAGALLPEHHTRIAPAPYAGPVYARQFWGSTRGSPHEGYVGLG